MIKVIKKYRYRKNMISMTCPRCKSIFAFTEDEVSRYLNSSMKPSVFNGIRCPCCKCLIIV